MADASSSSSARASSRTTRASCAPTCSSALCDEVAARHKAGDDVVIVTSGAIARGMRLMELPMRPTAMEELQAASAVGQGKLYRTYDELLQERGVPVGAGAAHVLRHVGAHPLPERAPHAPDAAALARAAGDQRERHHHHRRDLVRRQRLPRGAGGDPDRRRPARAAHRHRRPLQRRPAPGPRRPAGGGGERRGGARGLRHRAVELAARVGRDALEGGGGGDGHRGRDPGHDHERGRAGGGRGARSPARRAARASSRRRGACRASSCG